MKLLFLTLLSSLVFLPSSATAFEDPAGLMPKLDAVFRELDFSKAFHGGDQVQVLRKSCDELTNHCSETRARYEVLKASAIEAQVATYIGNRSEPSHLEKVSRPQWDQLSHNVARALVREIESYGQVVTLTVLRETPVRVHINHHEEISPGFELSLTYKANGYESHQQIVLSLACLGPGQVFRKTIEGNLGGRSVTEVQACELSPR